MITDLPGGINRSHRSTQPNQSRSPKSNLERVLHVPVGVQAKVKAYSVPNLYIQSYREVREFRVVLDCRSAKEHGVRDLCTDGSTPQ